MIEKAENDHTKDSSSQSSETNIAEIDTNSKDLQRKKNKAATSVNYTTTTAFKNTNYLLNTAHNTPNYFSNPFSIDKTSSTSTNIFVSPKFEGTESDAKPVPTPPFSNNIGTNNFSKTNSEI